MEISINPAVESGREYYSHGMEYFSGPNVIN